VLASTASPFKFAQNVLLAIQGERYQNCDSWEALKILSDFTGWEIPNSLKGLREKQAQEVHRCSPGEITDYLLNVGRNTV
jgi:threonine synthase